MSEPTTAEDDFRFEEASRGIWLAAFVNRGDGLTIEVGEGPYTTETGGSRTDKVLVALPQADAARFGRWLLENFGEHDV